jgi:hypothetical protein
VILEREIERKVNNYAKKLGIFECKLNSTSLRGLPDRLYIYKGYTFYIEFKRPDEQLTALQRQVIADMRAHGADVFVINNVQKGKELLDEIKSKRLSTKNN